MTDLPKEVGDREYQSYVRDPLGNVARSTFGGAYISDQDGEIVDVRSKDQIKTLSTSDNEVRYILKDIRSILMKLEEKMDLFFV